MDLNKVKNRRNDWKAWFNDYGGGYAYESLLHKLLKDYRSLGEWFKITKEVEQTLEELAVINYETYGQVFSQCATVKTLAPSH